MLRMQEGKLRVKEACLLKVGRGAERGGRQKGENNGEEEGD